MVASDQQSRCELRPDEAQEAQRPAQHHAAASESRGQPARHAFRRGAPLGATEAPEEVMAKDDTSRSGEQPEAEELAVALDPHGRML